MSGRTMPVAARLTRRDLKTLQEARSAADVFAADNVGTGGIYGVSARQEARLVGVFLEPHPGREYRITDAGRAALALREGQAT